jgi:hypothetical protein
MGGSREANTRVETYIKMASLQAYFGRAMDVIACLTYGSGFSGARLVLLNAMRSKA